MSALPNSIRLLFAIWWVPAIVNLLATNPFNLTISLAVIYGLWRGGDGARWYMMLFSFIALVYGVFLLGLAGVGFAHVWSQSTEIVTPTLIAMAGLVSAFPGGYTIWALRNSAISETLNQRHIDRVEARIDAEK